MLFDLHQPTTAVSTPTATDDFYALPFPNALRVRDDGTVNLDRYPRVGGQIDDYLTTIDKSPARFQNAGIFFRFDGAVDPATLPADPGASLADGASVFAVDLTNDVRTPLLTHFTALNYDFIGPNWVAALPVAGFPFHEGHDIAVLITDGLHGSDGKSIARAADFDAVLSDTPSSDSTVASAQTTYAPLRAWLAAHADVAKHVVGGTYFNAGTSTKIMSDLRAAVYAQVPTPPTLDNLAYDGEDQAGVDDIFEGTYPGPNFQQGDPPYSSTGGVIPTPPTVQRMETLRIAITVPKGDPPAAGWPVVIYQHGTGGDYKSFIGDGSGRQAAKVTDASGAVIAQMAMIGTDQVLHGPRAPAGTDVDTAFFNFLNLPAAHDNAKQGALDAFTVVRLIHAVDVASAPTTGKRIKFDASSIYFKGHSQGGLTGPLFLAAEPEVKAAILSGAGGGAHRVAAQQDRAGQHPAGRAGAPARSRRRVPSAAQPDPGLLRGHRPAQLRRASSSASRRRASPPRASSRRSASSTTTRRSRASRRSRSAWACSPRVRSCKRSTGSRSPRRSGARRRSPATSLVGRPPGYCSNIRRPLDTTDTSSFSTFRTRLLKRIAFLRMLRQTEWRASTPRERDHLTDLYGRA